MLRRKLLMVLGPLVALLAGTLIVSILLLQDVLRRLDHISTQSWSVVEQVGQLSNTISQVEIELYAIQLGREHRLDRLIDTFEVLREQTVQLGGHYVMHEKESEPIFTRLKGRLEQFERKVADLCTAQDPARAMERNREALTLAVGVREDVVLLTRHAAGHGRAEQADLAARFKWLVLGLAIIFLLVINASVLVLLRVAGMIMDPIDKLVAASRELAKERFDHRIRLSEEADEFDELARAYNGLAEQLQANEKRRLETLGHVALTLNHELNNALAMIELQLQLLSRRVSEDQPVTASLHRIRDALERMTRTVESLKHIKRIVLTDYVEGTKMLDLRRSTEEIEAGNDPSEARAVGR